MVFGGPHVDKITVFMLIFLMLYTTMAAGISYEVEWANYVPPEYIADVGEMTEGYEYWERHNISYPQTITMNTNFTDDATGPRRLIWSANGTHTKIFAMNRRLWWIFWIGLSPTYPNAEYYGWAAIQQYWDNSKNYSRLVFDRGTQWETEVLFFIRRNATHAIYDNITQSWDAGELTFIAGINATLAYQRGYTVGSIISAIGDVALFSAFVSPWNFVISGLWWAMVALTIVKLFWG